MQNVLAAENEGLTLKNTYINTNSMSSKHTFIIPVYENMPTKQCSRPSTTEASNTTMDLVKVNAEGGLRLRKSANGESTGIYLNKNEIVTRIEKATSKVAGTYWDKILKSDGTVGYAARETYESEANYKLYLVPIEKVEDISSTSKVIIDKEQNIIKVVPDVIAKDILDAFGGTVKITKADGSFLNGENDLIATGFIVEDKYTVVKKGDANADGKVDSFDYIRIMNYIMGKKQLTSPEKESADANNDGKVDSFDYIRIMNYIMGNKKIEI